MIASCLTVEVGRCEPTLPLHDSRILEPPQGGSDLNFGNTQTVEESRQKHTETNTGIGNTQEDLLSFSQHACRASKGVHRGSGGKYQRENPESSLPSSLIRICNGPLHPHWLGTGVPYRHLTCVFD